MPPGTPPERGTGTISCSGSKSEASRGDIRREFYHLGKAQDDLYGCPGEDGGSVRQLVLGHLF